MKDFVIATIHNAPLFISRAEELGFTELVLLAEPKESNLFLAQREDLVKKTKIKLLFGVIAQNSSQIPKGVEFDVIAKLGTSEKLSFPRLTHVINVEFALEKDYIHQRKSGTNHVLLTDYKQHNIELLFGYAQLQKETLGRQAQLLGRIMQNTQLCKKAGVRYSLCSFAKQPEELRHAKDVAALERTLGL
ncbi:hypothetical protein K9M74_05170 [Candidatus Woesearchaeota archaeon]|nr:hypothetical protein [Candidatus Woesearchaeota archaeon]